MKIRMICRLRKRSMQPKLNSTPKNLSKHSKPRAWPKRRGHGDAEEDSEGIDRCGLELERNQISGCMLELFRFPLCGSPRLFALCV